MSTFIMIHVREGAKELDAIDALREAIAKMQEPGFQPVSATIQEITPSGDAAKTVARIKICRNSTMLYTSGVAEILKRRLEEQHIQCPSIHQVAAALGDTFDELDLAALPGDAISFPRGTHWRKA